MVMGVRGMAERELVRVGRQRAVLGVLRWFVNVYTVIGLVIAGLCLAGWHWFAPVYRSVSARVPQMRYRMPRMLEAAGRDEWFTLFYFLLVLLVAISVCLWLVGRRWWP